MSKSASIISLFILSTFLTCWSVDRDDHTVSSLLPYLHDDSYAKFTLGGVISSTGLTQSAETGCGKNLGYIAAESYRHLGGSNTVKGYAKFTTGKIKDVSWNNSADFELVSPYVIGDPVGGDLTERGYDFGGAYAWNNRKWSIGVSAGYRAELFYRQRDPRDKITVSDLNVAISGSMRPGCGIYAVGVETDIRVYSQSSQIEVYSPTVNIPTYAMTGLGSWYPRFTGNSSESTAYSGFGYGITLSLLPIGEPSYATDAYIRFGNTDMRQYLREINNLHLTSLHILDMSAGISVLFRHHSGYIRPAGYLSLYNKTGDENLLGQATGNSYPVIGSRENYYKKRLNVGIKADSKTVIGRSSVGVAIGAEYYSRQERLISPSRTVNTDGIIPRLNVEWSYNIGESKCLSISGNVLHRFTHTGDMSLDLGTDAAITGSLMERNIAVIRSDFTTFGIGVTYSRPIFNGLTGAVSGRWQHSSYDIPDGNVNQFSLNITFTI